MTPRRIVRCKDGHPYDANANETCPVCGIAPAVREDVLPTPIPGPPPPQKRGWVTAAVLGTALVMAVGLSVGLHLHRPPEVSPPTAHHQNTVTPDTLVPVRPPQAATSTAPSGVPTEAERAKVSREQAEKAKPAEAEAVKKQAARDKAAREDAAKAASERAAVDKTKADAVPERHAAEPPSSVTRYMTVDQASVNAMRGALAPVDPAASNQTLDAVSPPFERQLRLSRFLREILANERAVQALKVHDFARMKATLSAIVSLPPIAPGAVSLAAHKNLAMYYARQGAPLRDLEQAARLTTIAIKGGLPSGMVLLLTRPGLSKVSGIDEAALSRFLQGATIEDPQMLEPVLRQKGLRMDAEKSVFGSFDGALARHDWPAAIMILQKYGDLRLPVFEMLLSQALMFAPNNEGFLDRILVGAMSGGAASYSVGTDLLGSFCLYGLDGVIKDGPNAAGWLIATLYGLPKNDPNWAGSRERYQQVKSSLSADQQQAIEQLAREFGVE